MADTPKRRSDGLDNLQCNSKRRRIFVGQASSDSSVAHLRFPVLVSIGHHYVYCLYDSICCIMNAPL